MTHKLRDTNINTPKYWNGRHSDFQNKYIVWEFHRFFLLKLISGMEEASILDIGCGRVLHFQTLSKKYPKLSWNGIDLAQSALEWNQENFKQGNFHCMDVCNNPLPDTYDYIVSMHTFEHLEDPVGLLERCRDHARKKVVINVPYGDFKTQDAEHLFKFDLDGPFTDFEKAVMIDQDSGMNETQNPAEAEEIYYVFDGRAK